MAILQDINKQTKTELYAASQFLTHRTETELGVQIKVDVYLQDPLVTQKDPKFGFDEEFYVRWEPGLADGPTSARFAVVDYNGDTGQIAPMAQWDDENNCFLDPNDQVLDRNNRDVLQFHQVNVWAILQRALAFFEEGQGLGRPIPFGFDGNRLIVVPHAGYGRNAFYDRHSKSLQFYYFDHDNNRVYTCLSTDIINHEFGHAVLDGIRPFYIESSLVQTAAFHEFIGDLTAILRILRNNKFRGALAQTTGGNLAAADHLIHIAEQFGQAVAGNPYLRTADNGIRMSDITENDGPHYASQVLTGTMFDILLALSNHYINDRGQSAKQAFWNAIQRMQRIAIQPLDFLPPVDVTFKDYALAVLRAEKISNPLDPYGYIDLMFKAFLDRKILDEDDKKAIQQSRYLYDRPDFDVFHEIDTARGPAAAYRFLDDNRRKLFIPANQDLIVTGLYDAHKLTREGRRLPRQVILEYIWREEVALDGSQFGKYNGTRTTMLCGGTLVFDENGNLLSWMRKPGTQGDDKNKHWRQEMEIGEKRKADLLSNLAQRIGTGQVGTALGSSKGLLSSQLPPLLVHNEDGIVQFELSPHLHLSGEDHEHYQGGERWEVSS